MMTDGEKMVWAAVYAVCMKPDSRGIAMHTARAAAKFASDAVLELRFACDEDNFWREMVAQPETVAERNKRLET